MAVSKNKLIPKEFSIIGHNINIVYDDEKLNSLAALGYIEPWQNKITLTKTTNGKEVKESVQEHSYFHEVVHLILKHMNENELYENEKFVDTFAGLLHQILKTSKY